MVFEYGRVDVFVVNVGVGEVEDFFLEEIDFIIGMLKVFKYIVVEVNFKGMMNCVKVVVF